MGRLVPESGPSEIDLVPLHGQEVPDRSPEVRICAGSGEEEESRCGRHVMALLPKRGKKARRGRVAHSEDCGERRSREARQLASSNLNAMRRERVRASASCGDGAMQIHTTDNCGRRTLSQALLLVSWRSAEPMLAISGVTTRTP